MQDSSTASRSMPLAGIFALVGGVLAAIASFLTWASVSASGQGVSAKGTDGSDGYFTLVAGLVLVAYGIASLTVSALGGKRALALIAIIAGLVAGGVALYDAVTAKERVLDEAASQLAGSFGVSEAQARQLLDKAVDSGQINISLSFGIFVVIGGGVLGLIGGVMGLRTSGEPAPAMPLIPTMGAMPGPPLPPTMPQPPASDAPGGPPGQRGSP